MSDFESDRQRKRRIYELEGFHCLFLYTQLHDSHVLVWRETLPETINLLKAAGSSEIEIAGIYSLSVTRVRWYAKGGQAPWIFDMWRERRRTSPDDLLWHSELPPKVAIHLEDMGLHSKEACRIFAFDPVETFGRYSVRIEDQWIPLKVFNQIRQWIGIAPYSAPTRKPTPSEVARARRILDMVAEDSRMPTPSIALPCPDN